MESELYRQEKSNASNMCKDRAHAPSVLGTNHAPNAGNPLLFSDIGPMELQTLFAGPQSFEENNTSNSFGQPNDLVKTSMTLSRLYPAGVTWP